MSQEPRKKRTYTRRSFLKGLPLGIAGALLAGVVSRRLLGAGLGRIRRPSVFSKGSIFSPARDRQEKT